MPGPPITISQARERVLKAVRRLGEERIAVGAALDRVLARDVAATGDVPPFPCSAMDGYAIKAGRAGRTLTVIGESRAGAPSERPVGDGQAIRVSTGAAVPDGAEAVIRQEDVDANEQLVKTQTPIEPRANIRDAGEVMLAGTVVLSAGSVLGAAELGAIVAAGAGEVVVARAPVVSVLCTGDELRAPGEPLGPGEIHNSNAPMLVSLATRCGAICRPVLRLPDDRTATEAALAEELESSDVVVVSGGVSVGPHDHVKPALQALGVEELFWRVALQPGGPTWFGERDGRLVFGLPGNPVSAFVTFSLFARPALLALQGASTATPLVDQAVLAVAVPRNPTREQAVRVRLKRRNGATVAIPNGPQGSHVMTSLLGADALALIPHGEGELAAGTEVSLEFLPD
jgi:molybdopterin molybdotransferase